MTSLPGGYRPFPAFAGFGADADLAAVDRAAAALDRTKATASEAALSRAVEVATRYAAVDTGAIEGLYQVNRGFTRTIATQSATWEAALAAHGDDVARSIADALAGYEFVLNAVTRRDPINQLWIQRLHEILCRSQGTYSVITVLGPQRQDLPLGAYKTMPNSPTNADTGRVHHYAGVDDTPGEMARLIDELNGEDFGRAHPALQAAYAHYAFVCIHPFADGNGRVARALASVFLYRRPGVPLVIFADQKDRYIDALEAADAGNTGPFVQFIRDRAVDAVELVRRHLDETDDAAAADLRVAMNMGTPEDVDASRAADRLSTQLATVLNDAFEALELPSEVHLRLETLPARSAPPEGTATPLGAPAIDLALTTGAPRFAGAARLLGVWQQSTGLLDVTGGHAPLEIRVDELVPTLQTTAELKVSAWCAAEARAVVRELAAGLRSTT